MRALAAQHLEHGGALIDAGNIGAVLRGCRINVVGRAHAAGSRHVLHDDVRVARDMIAHVAREQAGIEIIAAAGAETDHDVDRLALVEGLLRRCWRDAGKGEGREANLDPIAQHDRPFLVNRPNFGPAFLCLQLSPGARAAFCENCARDAQPERTKGRNWRCHAQTSGA